VDEIGWMRMHMWGCVYVDFLLPERIVMGQSVMQQSCGQKKKRDRGLLEVAKGCAKR